MNSSRFWIAAVLSAFIHLFAIGGLCAYALWPRYTPPELIEAYGDSDREGFPDISAVAINPGAWRQGDMHTPGGDGATESKPRESQPIPEPQTVELPTVPREQPTVEPPEPETAGPAPERPIVDPRPEPEGPPRPTGNDATGTTARTGLVGAPGGSNLPTGTPSKGGTVGTLSGIRELKGTVPPAYPLAAREAGIEGTVVVWMRVSAEGKVLDSRVHKSSNSAILDQAALRWARNQRYIPARRGNTPIEAEVTKPVRFYLE